MPKPRGWRAARGVGAALLIFLILFGAFLIAEEMQSSRWQARHFARLAQDFRYAVEAGASPSVRFPEDGPFDARLGYSRIPAYVQRLTAQGYVVDAQVRLSEAMLRVADDGYFTPYREKTQAGLTIRDCRDETLFEARFPERVYAAFDAIPALVVQTLLFIENRDLLDDERPMRNPAVDWSRLARAVLSQALKLVEPDYNVPGGSTLATQIEKYRHSPEGITNSVGEKLRQMKSATLRAYLGGEDTSEERRNIVRDYLNTVPLSAAPGYGEVNGIGDGLWVWYGTEFEQANRVLRQVSPRNADLALQGHVYRQVLALMIAHRRPSWYLAGGRAQLDALTDSHLRVLAASGAISPALRDAALAARVAFRDSQNDPAIPHVQASKAAGVVRSRLVGRLDEPLYALDRLDLAVTSTIDRDLQDAVTDTLEQLGDRAFAANAGLIGERMLGRGDPASVLYSFTLFERGSDANRVRVQADNSNQPLDINEGTKLELGSTAKLRTLATYLDVIAGLHGNWAGLDDKALAALKLHPRDRLGRFVAEHLSGAQDKSLAATLEAAMQRRYSAGPGESFFTGGGVHTFSNFRREDDGENPTVREALRNSINLSFIRIMRDVVHHFMYHDPEAPARLLDDDEDGSQRAEYLARFADIEGRTFMQRFYRKYKGKTPDQALDALLAGRRLSPARLAAVFRVVQPQADAAALRAFISKRAAGKQLSEDEAAKLHARYAPDRYSLGDLGWLARVHPLELWLVGYLREHPEATLTQVHEASGPQRQDVYAWLFKTRHKGAQDTRILVLLEADAFQEIHRHWRRLGYPFEALVSSYATALGSSGDRPGALAELMGIIVNDGIRLPTVRQEKLHFAPATPYETVLRARPHAGERVMAREIAEELRRALAEVVEQGTARRLSGTFAYSPERKLAVGGKTGTGDNRVESYGAKGQVLGSRALSRTATFVFYVGERHFGTLTAFVPGSAAADFGFTSALPVQILKTLAPRLLPFIDPERGARCPAGKAPVIAQGQAPVAAR
jgi:membrane peptidoglycan carboxypeptidase